MLYRIILGILGFLLIIFGMSITLRHWDLIMGVLFALSGPVLSIIGLVMMFYASSIKKGTSTIVES